MQSYAPFMKNMGWKDGKPNMINFDLDRVYGAPIYWIQKMYADNPVDSLLKFNAVSPIIQQENTGTAGFGVQDTKAEFKDVLIQSGKEILEVGVNLTKNDLRFNGIDSKACLNNDNSFAFNETGNQSVAIKNVLGSNYTISFKARKLSGKNGFRLFFHGNNFCEFGGDGNKLVTFGGEYFWKGGGLTPEIKTSSLTIENNRWYEVKLVVKGYDLSFYLDGVKLNQLALAPVKSLYVSAGKSVSENEIIIKVINVSSTAQRTQLQLPASILEPTAEVTLLKSNDKYDVNSLENPTKVVPQKFNVKGVSSDFEYVFPANSATILKLKRK
jgi:hypothetical protein